MATAKRNETAKACVANMAKAKKFSARSRLEWEMINTNNARGHVYDQSELCELYSARRGGHCGATKRTHDIAHTGNAFKHIVVKRFKAGGHIFYGEGTGNQLVDEIACWEKLALTPEADYICPILKYFTCKSDKVTPVSDKVLEKVLIIAQKAVHVDDLRGACEAAERMNRDGGFRGTDYATRKAELLAFAKRMHWRDVEFNPGNSGVIFDYAANCYKAVFIDYAL